MAISLHYSFEEGPVGMDSIWTRFVYVLEKVNSDFLTKIGRSANEGGGGGQPFSGRNSLTDHKKKLLTFPKLYGFVNEALAEFHFRIKGLSGVNYL